LYGPNGEIISETNPLAVQLEGESKVIIVGEPTVKINAAEANKEVAIQNVPTINLSGASALKEVSVQNEPTLKIAALEASKTVAIQNKITIANVEAGKITIEGQQALATVFATQPVVIAGITEGEKKVQALACTAAGLLRVEGIAGAAAEVQGKIAQGVAAADKPLATGLEDQKKLQRRAIGDEDGTLQALPFSLKHRFELTKTYTSKVEEVIAAVEGYRFIVTQIYAVILNKEIIAAIVKGTVVVQDGAVTVATYEGSTNVLTNGANNPLVSLTGNPVFIGRNPGNSLTFTGTPGTGTSIILNVAGYMVKA
jgi:hypothetical protein